MLRWHSLKYDPAKFLVVGTCLAAAFVEGCGKRFAVYEVRSQEWSEPDRRHYPSTTYVVKDAERHDYEAARAGKLPPTVFRSDDLAACVAFIKEKCNG